MEHRLAAPAGERQPETKGTGRPCPGWLRQSVQRVCRVQRCHDEGSTASTRSIAALPAQLWQFDGINCSVYRNPGWPPWSTGRPRQQDWSLQRSLPSCCHFGRKIIGTAAFLQRVSESFKNWQGLDTMLQLGFCRTQLCLPAPVTTISPKGCLMGAPRVRGSLARLQPQPQRLLHLANASDSSGPQASPPAVGYRLRTGR